MPLLERAFPTCSLLGGELPPQRAWRSGCSDRAHCISARDSRCAYGMLGSELTPRRACSWRSRGLDEAHCICAKSCRCADLRGDGGTARQMVYRIAEERLMHVVSCSAALLPALVKHGLAMPLSIAQ